MYPRANVFEKPYSKAQVSEIRRLFSVLEKARDSESVKAYMKKVLAEIKG